MGTFVLVSVFWACWTLPQFPSSLYVLATSGAITVAGILTVLGWVAGGVATGVMVRLARGWLGRRGALPLSSSLALSTVLPAALLLVLVAAGVPQVGIALGPRAAEVLATLRLEATTPVEAVVAVQGYYDQLADIPVQASPLLGMSAPPEQKPQNKQQKRQLPQPYTYMTRPADDFLELELIPGWSGEILGHRLTINRLGMRDREGITQEKPADVCRL